jgi:hypothetical protein
VDIVVRLFCFVDDRLGPIPQARLWPSELVTVVPTPERRSGGTRAVRFSVVDH